MLGIVVDNALPLFTQYEFMVSKLNKSFCKYENHRDSTLMIGLRWLAWREPPEDLIT